MVTQYVQQLYENESWKEDHNDAMYCRNVETAIEIGLRILGDIEACGGDRTTVSSGIRQCTAFLWWLDRSERLAAAIYELRSKQYVVDGADLFLKRIDDLRAVRYGISDTLAALTDIHEGRGAVLATNGTTSC